MASEEQRMAIEVLTKVQGWDAEKHQGWRGQGEQQVLDHVDRKHGIHPKDIHRYHERDEDDTDSQDESSHACASNLLSDGAILHLFALRSSLYMHTIAPCSQKNQPHPGTSKSTETVSSSLQYGILRLRFVRDKSSAWTPLLLHREIERFHGLLGHHAAHLI